jgi:hypothetical protein
VPEIDVDTGRSNADSLPKIDAKVDGRPSADSAPKTDTDPRRSNADTMVKTDDDAD